PPQPPVPPQYDITSLPPPPRPPRSHPFPYTTLFRSNLETRSELVVLIRRGATILGQLDVDSDVPAGFSDAHHQVVKQVADALARSEEHTSELQSRVDLVCRLLLEKKNNTLGRS